jgi:Protein of unknown function (DUF3108)
MPQHSHRQKLMNKTTPYYFSLLLMMLSFSTYASAFPETFSATYTLKKGSVTIGETRRILSHENDHYVFESITRPSGIATLFTNGQVVERSQWQFFQNRPRPLQYTFFNSGRKKTRRVHLDFDWGQHRVTNTVNGEPWSMGLEEGTSDKLLYQLQIMQDLPSTATTLRYPVADGGTLKHYEIKIIGTERIRTPLGVFTTTRLQHTKGTRKTTMWCAHELQYLPVRIEQRKGNDSPVTAVLTKLKGFDWPAEATP